MTRDSTAVTFMATLCDKRTDRWAGAPGRRSALGASGKVDAAPTLRRIPEDPVERVLDALDADRPRVVVDLDAVCYRRPRPDDELGPIGSVRRREGKLQAAEQLAGLA